MGGPCSYSGGGPCSRSRFSKLWQAVPLLLLLYHRAQNALCRSSEHVLHAHTHYAYTAVAKRRMVELQSGVDYLLLCPFETKQSTCHCVALLLPPQTRCRYLHMSSSASLWSRGACLSRVPASTAASHPLLPWQHDHEQCRSHLHARPVEYAPTPWPRLRRSRQELEKDARWTSSSDSCIATLATQQLLPLFCNPDSTTPQNYSNTGLLAETINLLLTKTASCCLVLRQRRRNVSLSYTTNSEACSGSRMRAQDQDILPIRALHCCTHFSHYLRNLLRTNANAGR